jgi:hypothetical protein
MNLTRARSIKNLSHKDRVRFYLYCANSVPQGEKGQTCIQLIQNWLDGVATEEECKGAVYAAARESGRLFDKDRTLTDHAFYSNAGGINVTDKEYSFEAAYYAYIAATHVADSNPALKLRLIKYLEELTGSHKKREI